MLVLTRKVGQEIVINGNILVKIIKSDGHLVKVGITAPRDVSVSRIENGVPVTQKGHNAVCATDYRTRNHLTGDVLETPLSDKT